MKTLMTGLIIHMAEVDVFVYFSDFHSHMATGRIIPILA